MPINDDGIDDTTSLGDEGADLFFQHLTDGKRLSDEGGEEKPKKEKTAPEPKEPETDEDAHEPSEDDQETEETTDTEETEKPSDEDDKAKAKPKYVEDEEAIVKVKIGDEEREVPVKDLKRLFGQEAALTQRSQEVAQVRKEAQERAKAHVSSLDVMLQRAQARYEPYSKLNFHVLAKDPNISGQEIAALQEEANKAKADVDFFGQELQSVLKQAEDDAIKHQRAEAVEAHKILSDPKTGIEGWSQPLYDDIRQYAVSQGIPPQVVNSVTSADQIKIIHKAMLYDKGVKAAAKTAKIVSSPTKVIKSASTETTKIVKGKPTDAMARLRRTGSTEDAEAVFEASILASRERD